MSQRSAELSHVEPQQQHQQALRTVEHYEHLVSRSGSEEVEQIGFFPLDLRPEVVNAVRPASRSSFRASDTTQSGGSSTATSASQTAGSPPTAQFQSPNGGTTYPRLSAVAAALRLPPYPLLPEDLLTEEERSTRAAPPMSAEEATEGAIQYRMKSIQRTKEGGFYQRFIARVAREGGVRRPTDPQTPVAQTKCSRKQWDQVFLTWRQALKSMVDTGQA